MLFATSMLHAQLTDPLFVNQGILKSIDYVNSSDSEMSPVYYEEGIAYVLYQKKSNKDRPTRGEVVFDIMFADSTFDEIFSFSNEINSSLVEGPFCIVDNEIFFSRTNNKRSEDGQRRLKIYRSSQVEFGQWSKPIPVGLPEGDFNYCHPSLDKEKRTMIFASDLPGGFGKMDLYFSRYVDSIWTRPINLGPEINGPGNEWTPFLMEDKLFFGSDSYTDQGDIDLYQAILSNDLIVKSVKTLAAPINSSYDEFGINIHPNGKSVLFSSARPGRGGDDVYEITFDQSLRKEVKPNSVLLDLELRDNQTKLPISKGKIRLSLVDLNAYGLSEYNVDEILSKSHLVNHSTSFLMETMEDGIQAIGIDPKGKYVLTVTKEGYKENRFYFDPLVDDPSWLIFMQPNKVNKEPPPVVRISKAEAPVIIPTTIGSAIVFNNIYYEFNSDKIIRGAQVELDALTKAMIENPDMKILLVSHTDAQGKESYNLGLSERRALEAKRYLENRGIERQRVQTEGKGETEIRNHCINNVTCTEQEHRFNRRTEVIILEN